MNNTLEILDRLVSFDTVSAHPNTEMIAYIKAFCETLGAQCTLLPSQQAGKSGLVARFGPDAPGGVVLSGHCDVVPVTGQPWTRPAFALTRENERLFGRGTTDMKGFLACMMATAKAASGHHLKKPLTLIFSYDEEVGCIGLQEMKPALPALMNAPRLCIVGEPTDMKVAIGHKGKVALKATCTGQSGHSALAPQFVNALHLAADFIIEIKALQEHYTQSGARDDAYDVPFTTLHTGVLQGGKALNIVPNIAEMIFEYRYLPADDEEVIRTKLADAADRVARKYHAQYSDAGISIEATNAYPGLDLLPTSDAATFAQSLCPRPELIKVAFGTEAGIFTELDIPTVVCGPGSMIGQGHKADEYIELSQLVHCRAMLDKAVATLH